MALVDAENRVDSAASFSRTCQKGRTHLPQVALPPKTVPARTIACHHNSSKGPRNFRAVDSTQASRHTVPKDTLENTRNAWVMRPFSIM